MAYWICEKSFSTDCLLTMIYMQRVWQMNNTPNMYMDYYSIADRAAQHLSKPHYIIAIILGVVAALANILSLAAVCHVRKTWSPHFRLLLSLMVANLLVDFTVILYVINKVTNPGTKAGVGPVWMRIKSRCGFMIIKALNTMGLNIMLMNLMGMALDHYLAILKPLHHSTLLDKGRTTIMIITFWLVAFVSGFSDFLSPLWELKTYLRLHHNYCEFAWLSPYQEEYTVFAIALVCLCLMVFMYTRIYHRVRSRIQREDMVKIARNRHALLTTLLILGSFMLCWLPTCLFQIALLVITNVKPQMLDSIYQCLLIVDKYFYDLLILNTLCDPIIYVIRINEVQTGYRLMFSKCLPFKFSRTSLQPHQRPVEWTSRCHHSATLSDKYHFRR